MAYRSHGQFCADWRTFCRPLSRDEKLRIVLAAEALERKSKAPGKRAGVLGYAALTVLRILVYRYHNSRSGLLCPTYATLQSVTGYCRSTIAAALARLERSGCLAIMRRLVRQRVRRVSPITGMVEEYTGTTQTSNLYRPQMPGAWAAHLMPVPSSPSPFPPRRQLNLLERMAATWKVSPLASQKQSTVNGIKPTHGPTQLGSFFKRNAPE